MRSLDFRDLPVEDQEALVHNIFGAASRWLVVTGESPKAETALLCPGRKLALLRQLRGWTQAELAKRAGVSQADVSRAEKSFQRGTLETLLKITGALKVSIECLTGGDFRAAARRGAGTQASNGAKAAGV